MKARYSKSIAVCVLISIALFLFAGTALAEVVGRLTRVEGAVDIMPGGQLPAVAAKGGTAVEKGDFVRTKSNSRAEITFNDGSVVKIAQRSRIDVSEYSGSARKLGLPRGKVQATVVPAPGGKVSHTFEIRTPNAIAGVRGTSFYVYHQANVTGVAVLEGVVHTASVVAPTKGVTLVAGTATTVTKKNPPTPPRPMSQTEMNSHKNDVTPTTSQSSEGTTSSSTTSSSSSGTTSTTSSTSTSGTETAAAGESTTTSGTTSGGDGGTSGGSTSTSGGTTTVDSFSGSGTSAAMDPSVTPTAFSAPADSTPETTTPVLAPAPTTQVVIPTTDATGTSPTPTPTPSVVFTTQLAAGLMSRDATIDPLSNFLTIVSDPGIGPTISGTTSLWGGTGSVNATLSGSYPTLPLLQPNHYFLGNFFSGSTTSATTADGGAFAGYFGGMSLDGTGVLVTGASALYVDPNGKAGIIQGVVPGSISSGTITGSGTLTVTELNSNSGLNPASFSSNWWDPKNGTTVVEVTGPALNDLATATSVKNGSPTEGFLLDAGMNFTSQMTDRGDVIRLGYLSADPSFGIWSRESFGSYSGSGTRYVLVSNAEWGTMDTAGIPTLHDDVRVVSLGNWQSGGALNGIADGVWGNLDSGKIRLLTGTLAGSSNSASSTFGAVTTGAFIDLDRFIANPALAGTLGFATQKGPDSFTLSGSGAVGTVSLGTVSFYNRSSSDPVQVWVAPNVTGSYSGGLQYQTFSLMNAASPSVSTVFGNMHITSVSPATGSNTWLGSIDAIGEAGSSFRSEFDGIAAGSFTATGFTGAAAGIAHPVTYFNRIDGGVTRYSGGTVTSYGTLSGIMGGMSLWSSTDTYASDFTGVGFFAPSTALTNSDYVFSTPIISKDVPTGSSITADGGAYYGHMVGGVSTAATNPGIMGMMNALYVDPSGNAGILSGKFGGYLDPTSNFWMGEGDVFPVKLASGLSPSSLNSGGVTTSSFSPYPGGSTLGGSLGITGWTGGPYTRSYIAASPGWGIGDFPLYASYTTAPGTGSLWDMNFTILDSIMPSFVMSGGMTGAPWDTPSGMLYASSKAGWVDTQAAAAGATPMTGIFIGETVGTFNPASLQAMTSGVWMETSKFLALAASNPAALQKLNIPAVEVGTADFSGGNSDFNVNVNGLRFFASSSTARPQVFATDTISGTFSVPNPTGSATLTQGAGSNVSGIFPTFTMKSWDTTTNKWIGSIDFSGNSGVVNGNSNIQFMGLAGGRSSGGSSGTFTGSAAGAVR